MKFISRKCLLGVLRVSSCSSKDSQRLNIQAIEIKRYGEKYVTRAVCGLTLASIDVGHDIEKYLDFLKEGESVVLSIHAVSRIEMLLKTYPKFETSPCEILEKFFRVIISEDVYSLELSRRDFPNLDKVIPEMNAEPIRISFQPELLSKIHRSLRNGRNDNGVTLFIHPTEPLRGIVIKSNYDRDEHTLGVLMPMSVPDSYAPKDK